MATEANPACDKGVYDYTCADNWQQCADAIVKRYFKAKYLKGKKAMPPAGETQGEDSIHKYVYDALQCKPKCRKCLCGTIQHFMPEYNIFGCPKPTEPYTN